MEFGQIVPLVLLIILLLAYAEVFYENRDKTPANEHAHAVNAHDQKSNTAEGSHKSHTLSTTTTASLPPHLTPSPAEAHKDTAQDPDLATAPTYAGFAFADIKSRLPRPFLDRSRHLILLICFFQILLGTCTGILLNIHGVGASGSAFLICIPWAYVFASAARRFWIVGRVVTGLSRKDLEEQFENVVASDSWERMTDRKGRVCYVHHGVREARWRAPSTKRYETKACP